MIDIDLGLSGARETTRVVVAMSGGVDSSVVAGLVKRAGYDAVGMTLQLYDHGAARHRAGSCCAGQDIHDAREVAARLGIPHFVLDYEKRFREAVIQPFAESYARGETPIPCVACNQTVKFADLLATARQLGAAALATGHYVRSRSGKGRRALIRPVELDRDQSYFLFATTQEQLDFLRFPLGDLSKDETRAIAREFGLRVAEKHDSQAGAGGRIERTRA
jgi:tRNA-specific 2-thiouridylase